MNYKSILGATALVFALPYAQAAPFDFGCTDCPITISSVGTPTITSTINVGGGGSITDLNVFINITHTFSADLDIFLIHDDTGTTVELTTDNGGSSDDAYTDTIFDDDAAVNIVDAVAPFSGTFSPEGMLADFNGESLAGSWTLSISDDFNLDGGELVDWAIFGTDDTAVPEPGILSLLALGLVGIGFARRRMS